MKTESGSKLFKRYDVRGIYPSEINEDLAYQIGGHFVTQLRARTVAVGRDMRDSGKALVAAFAKGACAAGADVYDIGLCSTDALYFAVGEFGYDGGVMVTASHNPAEYNGMKFTKANAEAMSLETGLSEIRDRISQGTSFAGERKGQIFQRDVLPEFAAHCLSFIDPASLRELRIAVDAGNGMGGLIVTKVFEKLPCRIVPLYFKPDGTFPNHPANPLEPENLRDLQKAVLEFKCHLGVAFDGDADRMFIVDEKGNPVGGDIVTALVAANTLKHRPGSKILYNLICSRSVPETITKHGGTPVKSPVGHSLIKKIMRDENIEFGGEHSGHFYFKNNWFADSGIIALLQCLEVFSSSSQPVSKIVKPIDTRFRSGEVNSQVADIPTTLKFIESQFLDGKIDHFDGLSIEYPDWWMNLRASNTEPMLRLNIEADSKELLQRKLDEVKNLLLR